ncbi:MAG: ATP-binding protein [Piscirickettsiaceae bacterium]|nr:MAG: ATP-binding protein [Piscirickettsiaceae bacterium]
MTDQSIFLGKGDTAQGLLLKQANRHGLIAGATGTGKTVSLRVLAEGFSRQGVPVFMADAKGDLSGMAKACGSVAAFEKRAVKVDYLDYVTEPFPLIFWDLYGEQGHPIRATIQNMGPLLLARMLELNEVQEGILNVAFSVAEDEKLPILDFKDLKALLINIADRSKELRSQYGNVSAQSIGAIQRKLLVLERQGAEQFFGEPELELKDMMRTDIDGRGYVSVLAADKLMRDSPSLYAIFLMWLLSRLFEELPEQGDSDKPKMVFFFDEAHLLFDRAPRVLIDRIEQVVRLIRSKGVGVYFVTQNPADIPDDVLGQLGNKIQHALRAYTPKDQKAIRAAAQSFRANPKLNIQEVIQTLGIGEALVSTLDTKGVPTMVEKTLIIPPSSQLDPLTKQERQVVQDDSPVLGKYDEALDRDSAHERLLKRSQQAAEKAEKLAEEERRIDDAKPAKKKGRQRQTVWESMAKSVVRSVGSSVGRKIAKSILKSFFK